MNFFLPIFLLASFSARTPNVQPNPHDYEIAVGVEKKGQVHLSRQWERELGKFYIDEEYWASAQWKSLRFRDRYVNKTSKGIGYNQFEVNYRSSGLYGGLAVRTVGSGHQPKAVLGWEVDERVNVLLAKAQLTVRAALLFGKVNDYDVYSKIAFGIMQNVSLYCLLKAESANRREDLQAKLGVEIEIPTLKGAKNG